MNIPYLLHYQIITILREQGLIVNNIARFSDGCASQFKSRHCNSDLKSLNEDLSVSQVTWHYFESHEGKNLSDTLGSIAKQAYKRGIKRENIGVQNASDVLKIIRDNIKESTAAFSSISIIEIAPFVRPSEKNKNKNFENILLE